jgi:putative flippase GtrA
MRFCIVGAVNTGIDFGLFLFLFYGVELPKLTANALSFIAATVNGYILNRFWTFGDTPTQNQSAQFLRFVLVTGGGLLMSSIVILLFSPYMPVYAAKIAAIGLTLIWNYTGSQRFVFRR